MPHPVFSPGAVALITGGASGIGLALAKLCAGHGMKLAIVDYNQESLSTAKTALGEAEVELYTADVSDTAAWKSLQEKVEKRFGNINLLVLNAGTSGRGGWTDLEYFKKVLDTNIYGVLNGLATFLPSIQKTASSSPSAGTAVVITGSKQGITNPPGNSAYNASKAAVKILAEQLSYDLRSASTSVHLLVPGWTHTGMTAAVAGVGPGKEKPAGAWAPEQVATYLEQAMGRDEFYVLCPDNDVSEDTDRRRILWTAGEMVERRPPMSRWREDWKERAQEGIEAIELPKQKKT